jgi:hypothetical protein
VAQAEKKLPTGLKGTSPNLDFYLENKNAIIGIESKFLELLKPKQPKFSISYSNRFLTTLDSGLLTIVNHCPLGTSACFRSSLQMNSSIFNSFNQSVVSPL